ncbi:Protocadherin Fat 1 [Trichinella zimbabwensis]|uniref:Protocadherin Fat 1 n=1 Tax=Trichinella zimbabwensis TaxID=268475 RepID=A0A0V1HG23_9BILA|nr:Protocadherin Fat 1 [Trichinella zimbabwensis]
MKLTNLSTVLLIAAASLLVAVQKTRSLSSLVSDEPDVENTDDPGCPLSVKILNEQFPLDGRLYLKGIHFLQNATTFRKLCSNRTLLSWMDSDSGQQIPLCSVDFSIYDDDLLFNGSVLIDWSVRLNSSECNSTALNYLQQTEFQAPLANGSLVFNTGCVCYFTEHIEPVQSHQEIVTIISNTTATTTTGVTEIIPSTISSAANPSVAQNHSESTFWKPSTLTLKTDHNATTLRPTSPFSFPVTSIQLNETNTTTKYWNNCSVYHCGTNGMCLLLPDDGESLFCQCSAGSCGERCSANWTCDGTGRCGAMSAVCAKSSASAAAGNVTPCTCTTIAGESSSLVTVELCGDDGRTVCYNGAKCRSAFFNNTANGSTSQWYCDCSDNYANSTCDDMRLFNMSSAYGDHHQGSNLGQNTLGSNDNKHVKSGEDVLEFFITTKSSNTTSDDDLDYYSVNHDNNNDNDNNNSTVTAGVALNSTFDNSENNFTTAVAVADEILSTTDGQRQKCPWVCLNGGQCVQGIGCRCPKIYLGLNCAFLHTCEAYAPCQHGGLCYLTNAMELADEVRQFTANAPYLCNCSDGWRGEHCELSSSSIDETEFSCAKEQCHNGGVCNEITFRCDCAGTGHRGNFCELPIDHCVEYDGACGAHGVCINQKTHFQCNCHAGYYGKFCNLTEAKESSSSTSSSSSWSSGWSPAWIIGAVFGCLSAVGLVVVGLLLARHIRRSRELKGKYNPAKEEMKCSAIAAFYEHFFCDFKIVASWSLFNDTRKSLYMSFDYDVFLGGSCGATTWRQELIPHLRRLGITFFNPQRDSWCEDMIKLEHDAKEKSRILLFVVDYRQRSLVTLIEIVYLAALRAPIIVVLPDERSFVAKPSFSEYYDRCKTVDFVRRVLHHHRVPTCVSVDEAVTLIEGILLKNKAVKESLKSVDWLAIWFRCCLTTAGSLFSLPLNLIFFFILHHVCSESFRMHFEYILRYRFPKLIILARVVKYAALLMCMFYNPIFFILLAFCSLLVAYVMVPVLKRLQNIALPAGNVQYAYHLYMNATIPTNECLAYLYSRLKNLKVTFALADDFLPEQRLGAIASSLCVFYAVSCSTNSIYDLVKLGYAIGTGATVVANFSTDSAVHNTSKAVCNGGSGAAAAATTAEGTVTTETESPLRSYCRAILYLKDMASSRDVSFFENDLNSAVDRILKCLQCCCQCSDMQYDCCNSFQF